MSALGNKMRARREAWAEVQGFRFHLRLPTALQISQASTGVEVALQSVIGWEGVKACDLIPNEPDEPAAFDSDACREFLSERLDLLADVVEEVRRLKVLRDAELETGRKN
jgi:hypothetical protein